jgi:hypothetical protein
MGGTMAKPLHDVNRIDWKSFEKLGLWPKVEEGSIFRTQEYYSYFEDLKIEPDKEIGP